MSANISTKPLTDTQFALLSAAAQRADRALVLPDRLKGNAAQKAAEKLVGLGIAEEIRGGDPRPRLDAGVAPQRKWPRDDAAYHQARPEDDRGER